MPDLLRIARAVATNQLARFAPSLYVRVTRQTGRGARESETPAEIVTYFRRCVRDYFSILGIPETDVHSFLKGKTVLEYGPGDLPGVALLLVELGAEKVYCVDRFPMLAVSDKNAEVINRLILEAEEPGRQRIIDSFVVPGSPRSGFSPNRIEYLIRPSGLSGLRNEVDLVISRAVLEHVDDLPATFSDMTQAMRDNTIAVHQVDLKSHGLHRRNPLDFLTLSPALWSLMYSHKGVPNRWRVDRYREIVSHLAVDVTRLEPTVLADFRDIADVRPSLAKPFSGISDEDLSWLGFWLVLRKNGA